MSTIRLSVAVLSATLLSASVLAESRGTPDAARQAPIAAQDAKAKDPGAPLADLRGRDDLKAAMPQATRTPRERIAKTPSPLLQDPAHRHTGRSTATGRVIVKFNDELKVRAPRSPSAVVQTVDGVALPAVTQILSQYRATAWQALDKSPEWLKAVEERAESNSGIAAPDLAGMIYVQPDNDLVGCARALNELPEVEFVVIEQMAFPARQQAGAQTGCASAPGDPCELPPGAVNCNKPGIPPGLPNINGRCSNFVFGSGCSNNCAEPCDNGANDFDCIWGCNDATCCGTISTVQPGCVEGGWDALCAFYANLLCNRTVYDPFLPVSGNQSSLPGSYKYDPCFALRTGPNPGAPDATIQATTLSALGLGGASFPFELVAVTGYSTAVAPPPMGDDGLTTAVAITGVNPAFPSSAQLAMQDPSFERIGYQLNGGCFNVRPGNRGCSNTPCCVYVCVIDQTCCIIGWDENCVRLARTADPINPCVQPLAGNIAASTNPGPADFPVLNQGNFPAGGATPDFTPKIVTTGFGLQSRNLQAWLTRSPAASSLEDLSGTPGVGISTILAPTNQGQLDSSRMFLNSGFRGGGLDIQGFESALAAIGVAGSAARGGGIVIGVVDNAAFVDHEEFAGRVSVEPGIEIVTSADAPVDPHHGTAVLGIMLAAADGKGITGVAPDATGIFFPAFGGGGVGGRLLNALGSAVGTLTTGDVLLVPLDFPVVITDPLTGGTTSLGGTILQSPEIYLLSVVASQIGIAVVVAAGNECSPVVTSPGTAPPSAAVVVGAVWPGQPRFPALYQSLRYCRLPFSNFTNPNSDPGQNEVDVAGWGAYVATCGYGDLWRGGAANSNNRTYTIQFGGTSAASAMIAGCVARMQSATKALFDAPLTPQQVKTTVRLNRFLQCGVPQNSPFQLTSAIPCAGDTVNDGEFLGIGGFIDFGPQVVATLTNEPIGNFPEGVINYEIQILVGRLLSGSVFSLLSVDGNQVRIRAARAGGGTVPPVGPGIFYPSTAVISDMLLTVTTIYDEPQQLSNLSITAIGEAIPSNSVYTMFFVFNVQTNRWLLLPDTLTFFDDEGGGVVNIGSGSINLLYNTINLIDTSSGQGKVRFRLVTIGPPTVNTYQTWWDFVQVQPNPPLEPPIPCWVAREVYGANNPRWVYFRTWLDRHAPSVVRDAYDTFAPTAAEWLKSQPTAKKALRSMMDVAIGQLSHEEIRTAIKRFGWSPDGQIFRARVNHAVSKALEERALAMPE
ncbi:MAG: S8 family serine peptidase [Phycisphaeraceae bacterium]|nr:S8 family serine peptidase [Phycisphaeraceae bacterium]